MLFEIPTVQCLSKNKKVGIIILCIKLFRKTKKQPLNDYPTFTFTLINLKIL